MKMESRGSKRPSRISEGWQDLNFCDTDLMVVTQFCIQDWMWISRCLSTLWYAPSWFDRYSNLDIPIIAVSRYLTDSSLSLPELISSSQTTKARLLHYFPPSETDALPADDEPVDSWCGFHLDHSLLTGLCSVRFIYLTHYSMFS